MKILLSILLILFLFSDVGAKEATPMADDPELEKKVNEVSAELRCLVCQNQTISDSHAALAVDLKNQVREMLADGKTKAEVVSYMTERYGDFVLYRPPMKPTTLLLWFGPFLLLTGGGIILFISLKNRRKQALAEQELSDDEREKVDSLMQAELKNDDKNKSKGN